MCGMYCEVACVGLFHTSRRKLKRIVPLIQGFHFDQGTLGLGNREVVTNVSVGEAWEKCPNVDLAGFCRVNRFICWLKRMDDGLV